MSAALLTLILIIPVGALALLSHWARKSPAAEISLAVVLLVASILIALLGAFTSAGLLLTGPGDDPLTSTSAVVAALVAAAVGFVGIGLCVPPLLKITDRSAGGWWSNPPVFFATWLFVVVLGNNVFSLLLFTQVEDFGALLTGSGARVSPGAVLVSQLPLVALAVLGVGIGLRRGLRDVAARLGYGGITLPQLGVVAAFVAGALLLSAASDRVFEYLQPALHERVGEITSDLFSIEGMGLSSVLLFGLLLGLGAAAGEETLFRGALQPVFGVVLTSLLFASLHVQYGPSVSLGYIFLLSVGLGILRSRINTTAAFVAHAGYNFSGVLLAYLLGGM